MERAGGHDEVVRSPSRPHGSPKLSTDLLTAAIIVRNEADHLRRCLTSISELCDRMVVVDTGSDDETVEVARGFGATVLHKEWRNDFAASRNLALDAVRSEWVLYIDADEEVVGTDVRQVRERLASSTEVEAFGIQMILRHGWTPYTDYRIWRHHPEIRFRGLIHESSMNDITRIAAETGRSLAPLDLLIQHHGYEGNQAVKHRRNLPLLRAELERSPDNMNLWNHLGRIHRELGMPDEAETAWREGIRRVRLNGQRSFIDVHVFASLADLMISRGEDPTGILREARELDASFHTLTWLEARYLMGADRPEDAEPLLEQLIDIGRRGPEPSGHAYDTAMFDLWPKSLLATSVFAQCRFKEAMERFADARRAGFDPATAEAHIETCRRAIEMRRSEGATHRSGRAVLEDAVFLMAVRVDSAGQLRNVVAGVRRLLEDFDAPIVVGSEQPDALREVLPPGVVVLGVEGDPDHPFHASRTVNRLVSTVSQTIRINFEPGVIVPASQILEAVGLVRRHEADLVLPFDVAFVVPESSQSMFLTGASGVDPGYSLRPIAGDPPSGCRVWRDSTFDSVGGENEFVIGRTSSDPERARRVTAFGHRVARVPGPCFHMGAPADSATGEGAVFRELAAREIDRIAAMMDPELRTEVSGWSWMHSSVDAPRERIEADDLTVTIPVRPDSADRLRNLIVCTNALARGTTARVVVGVGDPDRLSEMLPADSLHPRVEVVRVHDPEDQPFHRTRILNHLARLAETPFIANLDADIVVPADQWGRALELLRSGEAEFVLPYGGRMEGVSFAHHPWLERGDFVALPPVGRTLMHPNSVGGCILWNREHFLRVGMENENLVSWGFDDDERLARATTLGLSVRRVPGTVYHLYHRRGPDSRPDHPHLEANRAVYETIRESDSATLAAEVATWPWAVRRATTTVLVWGDTWHRDGELFPLDEPNLLVSRDRAKLADASVVLFPLPTLDTGDMPRERGHGDQRWVLLCRESKVNFPLLADAAFRSRFDAVASYELDCDLPMPYAPFADMSRPWPVVPPGDRMKAPACAWVSGPWDRWGRRDFMAELMLHMQVDSYGLILNNTGDQRIVDHHRRREITSRYRFALALENSIAPDYVTEKMFEALFVGAVPVYMGAPNVDRFLPGDRCVVDASNFGSVAELAEYLEGMDDAEYMSFHEWRWRPLRDEFVEVCGRSGSLVSWLRARCSEVR